MQDSIVRYKKSRILVVDDSHVIREQLSSFLKRRGYICRAVADAEQALMAVEKNQYDVIILDVVMPGMDGFTACKRIKAIPSYRQVPVVLLTSKDSSSDRLRGTLSGCERYLIKPLKFEELDDLVLNLGRSRRQNSVSDEFPPITEGF